MTEQIINNTPRWKKALVPVESTIRQAIANLDQSTMQIALVTSEDGVLIGTITDGDIRRGLLKGLDLDSPIDSIINYAPLVVPSHMERDTALQIMQVNRVRQLPVVDEEKRVVDLYLLKELLQPARRSNLMVIMAGGKGTRLRPYTENCPKPLLTVGDKPMLEHIIERAKSEGFENFILTTHYLAYMIEDYFKDGSPWQINIQYIREDSPLGTAGALSLLSPAPLEPFVVTNGDVLTDVRYGELLDFHVRHKAVGTMAVRLHEWQYPYGVVHTDGVNIIEFEEKPIYRAHVNAGVYVMDPHALRLLKEGEYHDMPTLFQQLQNSGERVIAYPMHEPWIDVGSPSDFEKASYY